MTWKKKGFAVCGELIYIKKIGGIYIYSRFSFVIVGKAP